MSEIREEQWRSEVRSQLAVQLSAELERLPGVLAAGVWLGDGGEVAQVRIHTQPQASATVVAHAATRVLEQRGQQVDAGAVRVIPVISIGEAGPPQSAGRYLVLHDVGWTRQGSRFTCRVQLARDSEILRGEATELDTEAGRSRAAALATLQAAESVTEGLALGLEGVALVPLFGRRYIAVGVEAVVQRRFAQLSAMVGLDPARPLEEAAAMATLRAIERWLAL